MIVDHICFAVKNLEEGVKYWNDSFGYSQKTPVVENTRQKVRVTFIGKDNSLLIKLIEPVEGNVSLQNFVNRGGGFHHICFKCEEVHAQVAELKEKGLISLVPPQPGEAFQGHDIAFLLAKYGINIELIDTDEKTGMTD